MSAPSRSTVTVDHATANDLHDESRNEEAQDSDALHDAALDELLQKNC